MSSKQLQGVYLISNDDVFSVLQHKLQIIFDHLPVALFQYRRKQVDEATQYHECEQLQRLCAQYAVPLIINDSLRMALHFQAGLHIGQGDGSLLQARQSLGDAAIIGRTCHGSLSLAAQASAEGASYLAFGAMYSSQTKPNAEQASLSVLQQTKQRHQLPVCAIGGLTAENSLILAEAGVDLLAVVGDLLNSALVDIPQRARAWQHVLTAYK